MCYPRRPGFCTTACTQDADCGLLGDSESTCFEQDGACHIECPGNNSDACPEGFRCENVGVFPVGRRCMPRAITGPGTQAALQPCDLLHGDTDCMPGLVCYRWDETQVDGPGYCTAPCSSVDACTLPMGGELELGCGGEGACRFHCSEAPCPDFLECELIEGRGGRCHYPADTQF